MGHVYLAVWRDLHRLKILHANNQRVIVVHCLESVWFMCPTHRLSCWWERTCQSLSELKWKLRTWIMMCGREFCSMSHVMILSEAIGLCANSSACMEVDSWQSYWCLSLPSPESNVWWGHHLLYSLDDVDDDLAKLRLCLWWKSRCRSWQGSYGHTCFGHSKSKLVPDNDMLEPKQLIESAMVNEQTRLTPS